MPQLLVAVFLLLLAAGCSNRLTIDDSHPSENQDSRVRFVVLHYTVGNFPQALRELTKGEVSAHYLIDNRPPFTIYRLVDEQRRAWHAGESAWQGNAKLNSASIGIELVNGGCVADGLGSCRWQGYPKGQIDQLLRLLKDIKQRHALGPNTIIGHSDIAPQRKTDPGPLFPWKRLADGGLIRWPNAAAVANAQNSFTMQPPDARWYQQQLAAFGYLTPTSGVFDKATNNVIAAFQMRYRPARYDGQPDPQTAAILAVLNGFSR